MIWIQNQLVGAYEGQQMTLECHSEAYPRSINYWTREKGEIVPQSKSNITLPQSVVQLQTESHVNEPTHTSSSSICGGSSSSIG